MGLPLSIKPGATHRRAIALKPPISYAFSGTRKTVSGEIQSRNTRFSLQGIRRVVRFNEPISELEDQPSNNKLTGSSLEEAESNEEGSEGPSEGNESGDGEGAEENDADDAEEEYVRSLLLNSIDQPRISSPVTTYPKIHRTRLPILKRVLALALVGALLAYALMLPSDQILPIQSSAGASRGAFYETRNAQEGYRLMTERFTYLGEGVTERISGLGKSLEGLSQKVDDLHNKLVEVRNAVDGGRGAQGYLEVVEQSLKEQAAQLTRTMEERLLEVFSGALSSGVIPTKEEVSAAISKAFGNDLVGLVDYASVFGGASIIKRLTSKTYEPGLLGGKRAHPAVAAITRDITVGDCWTFAGSNGQLGIQLSKTIRITHITIDHPDIHILPNPQTAPRGFSVWIPSELRLQEWDIMEWNRRAAAPEGSRPWGVNRRLGTFEYDIHSENHVQTFAISEPPAVGDSASNVVVFLFESNWGEEQYTSIYRVRVHGVELEAAAIFD